MVRKRKGAPKPQVNIGFRNEATSEEEKDNEDQPPYAPMLHDEGTSSISLHELTARVDSLWNEHQEFEISVNQQLEEFKAQNTTILTNRKIIQRQLAQLNSYHAPQPPPP